jgi:hypothetical protein
MKSLKIFQTFHKDFVHNTSTDWVQPVGVGGFISQGFTSDADGDNIAALNKSYCELTVQYWAWKNTQCQYVGFFHYRRYMLFKLNELWLNPGNMGVPLEGGASPNDQGLVNYLTDSEQRERLESLLGFWDVITPRPLPMTPSIEQQYLSIHDKEPWEEFLRVIKLVYSAHPGCENYFKLATQAPIWNIFVMRRDLFEEYCFDLFLVIDAVYAAIGEPYDSYNNRYPGFLAERFLGFWLALKRVRVFEAPSLVFT